MTKNVFKSLVVSFLVMTTAACISCGPVNDLRDFSDSDLFPPIIENILPADENRIILSFNEPVELNSIPVITPGLGEITETYEDNSLILSFTGKQEAGVQYVIDAEVMDETGNRMSFLIQFYGFNPHLPELLINEFTTQGSAAHPDVVELVILKAGNLAGLWIIEGTRSFTENEICLPDCEVEEGDFIVIHFKPQGIPEEIDESGSELDISGGLDASPEARDFWVKGGTGLSGNNGVIAVYSAPGGRLLDGVLYSNRTSLSDEKYSGFGSTKMKDKAYELVEEGGWIGSGPGGVPIPEDGVNPDDSTATRSMCRSSEPIDTNRKTDWHIVPTSGSTFGTVNSDAVHIP